MYEDRLLCTECFLSRQMGKAEGIINDEIPNCWECPKCHKEGKTSKVRASPVNSKSAHEELSDHVTEDKHLDYYCHC